MRPLARHLCASLLGLALVLISAGPAAAQFLGQPRGIISPMAGEPRGDGRITGPTPVFSASFATPGAFASPVADTGQAITVARASSATYCVSGSRLTATSNQLRVEAAGALIEPAGTNSYLNSDTPATQTITLGTGTYTAWMEGSGSQAVTVGTATATGLPCTASGGVVCGTHATICTFTVTVGGTITVTKTGSPTNTTVENSASVTSYIPTGGTAATRSADRVASAFSYQLGAKGICAQMDVRLEGPNANGFNIFLEPYIDGTNVWFFGTETTPKARLNGFFASTSHLALSAGNIPVGAAVHMVYRYDGSNETTCVNGTCTSTAFSFSAPTAFNGMLIGDDFGAPGLYEVQGNIGGIKLFANAGSCQ